MVITVAGHEAEFEQAADGSWSAMVPDLPTILTCGKTLDEAKSMVTEAIGVWFEEHALQLGQTHG